MIVWSFSLTEGRPVVLLTITRVDGTVVRITTASQSITIGLNTWIPQAGLVMGRLTERSNGEMPSLGFNIQLGTDAGLMKLSDVHNKKYRDAQVEVDLTNADNPLVRDFVFIGLIKGSVNYDAVGRAGFDLVSKFAVPRDLFIRKYQLLCDADFGDPVRCKIPTFPYVYGRHLGDVARSEAVATGGIRRVRFAGANTPEDYANVYLEATTGGTTAGSAPSFSSTVGATVADGSVVWTTRNAWARAVRIAAVSDQRTLVLDRLPDPRASGLNTWYSPGSIMFTSGDHAMRRYRIGSYDAVAATIETYLPCPLTAVNDWAEIAPDCDHTITMCADKYANANNYRGFPNQLGARAQAQQLGYA